MVTIRTIEDREIPKIRDIDRAETIQHSYRFEGGKLIRLSVDWEIPGWFDGDGAHSVDEMIRGTRRDLDFGGTAFGAFDGDRLVGLAVYRPGLWPAMGQLAGLHVSREYRRRGIASRLLEKVLALARGDGAACLYVSATPSDSAVGFYRSKGFAVTSEPDPQLLAEEPEDIHMVLEI
jgi:ribosomal protein S18 acetylase RimI-like enzyme